MEKLAELMATIIVVIFVLLFNVFSFGLKLGIVFYFANLLLTNLF